jgi:hypothetical protein
VTPVLDQTIQKQIKFYKNSSDFDIAASNKLIIMKTICTKTKIKKEYIEEVRQWFQSLENRINETLRSLENEKVIIESAFLDKQGDDYYLIYYMKAEDLNFARQAYHASTLEIDKFHKSCWKKYCEQTETLEALIDLNMLSAYKDN